VLRARAALALAVACGACNTILGNAEGVYVPATTEDASDGATLDGARDAKDGAPTDAPATETATDAATDAKPGCARASDCATGLLCDWSAHCTNACVTQGSACARRTDCCIDFGCFKNEGDEAGACFGCFSATSLCKSDDECCSGRCTNGACT
jgi:hypothetical protein